MKIHEFQAKQIIAQYGVAVPKGRVAASADDAKAAARELGGRVVVKAQIHAGGRGKGGGVKLANSPGEAAQAFSQIMGMQLVTHQTGPQGQTVKTVLVEEQMPIERELYLAVLIDGAAGRPVMMASAAGGMEIEELRDKDEEDPSEVEASEKGISNFIKLDGNIGCLVNGAGLAMATMDSIKFAGGEPANFLDIATANDVNKVVDALQIIARDPNVKAILVNIFGGMARVDVIAQGIIEAQRQMPTAIPVVARLAGTNVEEGERLIRESGLPVIRAEELGEAAKKAVEAAKSAA